VLVHSIWFASIVPGFLAAVWIWPALRIPKFWFSLAVATLLGITVWLAIDIHSFLDGGGQESKISIRLLYTPLRETDVPAVPLAFGFLLAGLCSKRLTRRISPEDCDHNQSEQ